MERTDLIMHVLPVLYKAVDKFEKHFKLKYQKRCEDLEERLKEKEERLKEKEEQLQ